MKIVFYHSIHKAYEQRICDALGEGMAIHGDELILVHKGDWVGPIVGTDGAMMFGVKARRLFAPHKEVGIPPIFVDKGYLGLKGTGARADYFKFSVGSMHPLSYFQAEPHPGDRFKALKITVKPWRSQTEGSKILLALSSRKYCVWYGIDNPHKFAAKIVREIQKVLDMAGNDCEIIYRPKPSWDEAQPVKGAGYSRPPEGIRDVLRDTHCLVTHGSNAAIDAILMGVPVVVLGPGIAQPVASRDIKGVIKPYRPSRGQVDQWLRDIAYCQWTTEELRSGLAWDHIRKDIWRELRCR